MADFHPHLETPVMSPDQPKFDDMLSRFGLRVLPFTRELRVEDLRGSAGVQRLREELLMRVNTAVHPIEVRDVLFKEMLVQ